MARTAPPSRSPSRALTRTARADLRRSYSRLADAPATPASSSASTVPAAFPVADSHTMHRTARVEESYSASSPFAKFLPQRVHTPAYRSCNLRAPACFCGSGITGTVTVGQKYVLAGQTCASSMKMICDVAHADRDVGQEPWSNPSGSFVGGDLSRPNKRTFSGPASFLRTCHGLVTNLRAGRSDLIHELGCRPS